jgi:arylsulfatase A-like enzyme
LSEGRTPVARRGRALGVAAALLVAAGLAWYWAARRAPVTDADARAWISRRHPAPTELNLVVVTLDTLRADRLGCYGFEPTPSPRIDALARDGVVFEQATATVPLTLPSHSSIFTGLLPPRHGVRDNGGFFLEDAKTTLAELLKPAGYATGAFVGAWVLDSKWGLAQGFDRYADKFDLSKQKVVSLGTVQKPGDEVMDGRWPGWSRCARAASSPGSTSTTRTPPTRRPSPISRATRASATWARWPTPTRWWDACSTGCGRPGSTSARSSC